MYYYYYLSHTQPVKEEEMGKLLITQSRYAQPSSAVKDEKKKSWEENQGKSECGKAGEGISAREDERWREN